MPLNTDIYSQLKTFPDYQRADQAFQLQRATQLQALQTGGIDAASKSNILGTQLVSAATDQTSYDAAKQRAATLGIDMSNWAPDYATGAQQAQQARLAQSPLGSLISAGSKLTANDLSAVQTYGSMEAAMKAGYKPEGVNLPGFGISGTSPAASPAPAPPAPSAAPAPMNAPLPTGQPDNVPAKYPPTPQGAAGAVTDVFGSSPAPAPLKPIPAQLPASSAKFNPPAQNAGESITAYNQRVQQAFEAYKSDPSYVASQSAATETGKNIATANMEAIRSSETANRLKPNFDALRAVNNDVPDGTWGISPEVKAWASAANPYGDHKASAAMAAWNMVNEQQVLNALGQLVSGGQIKSNRQIAKMLETGNFVPADIDANDRLTLINTLEKESANQATSAGNISSRLQGGATQPYVPTMPQGGVGQSAAPAPANSGIKFLGFK